MRSVRSRRASSDSSAAREGRQHDLLELLARALRVGIEEAQRGDRVALELDPHRELAVRRIDVEEAAAHRQISRFDDEVAAPISEAGEALDEAGERDLGAARQEHGQIREAFGRGQAHEQRSRGQDGGGGAGSGAKRRQQPELVAARLERGRDPLVRGQGRRRGLPHAGRPRAEQVAGKARRVLLVRDDGDEGPLELLGQRGGQDRRQRADAARNDEAVLSRADTLEEVRVGRQSGSEVPQQHVERSAAGR